MVKTVRVEIPYVLLDGVTMRDTPTAGKELLDHHDKYEATEKDTVILTVSEAAAKELEQIGGKRLNA